MKAIASKTGLVVMFALITVNVLAQKYYTTSAGGTWEGSAIWGATTSGAGAMWSTTSLVNDDIIQIDDNTSLDTDLTIATDVHIILDATLSISKKLRLTANSTIEFTENGSLVGTGPGNSEKVSFGGDFVWSGNDGTVTGPGTMDVNYSGTLPVSLISFDADVNENQVVLSWATASELNNNYFTLERSRDGRTFETVTTLGGAGTTNEHVTYSFTDNTPYFGRSYYRLSQTDFDGTSASFDLVTVDISSIKDITVYPNPVNRGKALRIETGANADEDVSVEIYSHTGQLMKAEKLTGNSSVNIEHDLEAGYYMLQVKSGKVNKSTRLVIQ